MTGPSQLTAPRTQLTLLALIVLTAHALLLGLLQGIRSTAVDGIAGDALVFQTRLIALAPPQSALPAVWGCKRNPSVYDTEMLTKASFV